jgi:murein DD-endopeptidase / murein LD-carboxypeptidase
MRKYYRLVPYLAIFFVLNCLSVYAKLINPLAFIQGKKTSKVTKAKKSSLHNKFASHKKSKKSHPITKKDEDLKVSILLPEEDNKNYIMPSKNITYSQEVKDGIMDEIQNWFSTRYKWGGKSKKGIDCSGFTSTVYENVLSILLPRSSHEQFKVGKPIEDVHELKFGDLVFFKSGKRVPGHVGIYVGDGMFAHSSSYKKRGVTISRLDEDSYLKRYIGARRILDEPRSVIGGE